MGAVGGGLISSQSTCSRRHLTGAIVRITCTSEVHLREAYQNITKATPPLYSLAMLFAVVKLNIPCPTTWIHSGVYFVELGCIRKHFWWITIYYVVQYQYSNSPIHRLHKKGQLSHFLSNLQWWCLCLMWLLDRFTTHLLIVISSVINLMVMGDSD